MVRRLGLFRVLVVLLALFSLSGCIGTMPVADLPLAPEEPVLETDEVELPPYKLQVGDVLDIKVMSNPELNDQVTVRPDGLVTTMLASDVRAAGRTPSQLERTLQSRAGAILKRPKVTVIVRAFAPNRVYVLGEVRNPGEFITVGPNLTLLQAIARAGGLSNSAQPDDIVIIRRGISSHPEAYAADYMAAASGEDPLDDVRLAPYDVVFVPRSGAADAYLYFQQYLQQFAPDSASFQATHNF
jgi:polysaccharide export outer membrane protein